MKSDVMSPVQPANRGRVIALHCSGAGTGQWKKLGEVLGPTYQVTAPEHYGCEQTGPWIGTHAFTLEDEAARTIDIIDRSDSKVHLVGHSYGGGVALHVALARPDRIASLAFYEPSAFHLLKEMGDEAAAEFRDIVDITRRTGHGVIAGDYAGAAAAFVDYWSGPGAWASLKPSVQAALIRWVVKAPLDFRALIEEPTPPTAYAGLRMPVLVMRGEHAPRPTRKIAEVLPRMLPHAELAVVDGAGHMGPLTHGSAVSELIASHIRAAETATRQPRLPPARCERGRWLTSTERSGVVIDPAHRYPTHLIDLVHLANGCRVVVRPPLPQDCELQRLFVRTLSDEARYFRFMTRLSELSKAMAERFTSIDYRSHMALIATVFPDACETMIGEARYIVDEDGGAVCELAVAVADAWRGMGLARTLLQRLTHQAATSGIRRMVGDTVSTNQAMIALARSMGFGATKKHEDGRLVHLVRDLPPRDRLSNATRQAFGKCVVAA